MARTACSIRPISRRLCALARAAVPAVPVCARLVSAAFRRQQRQQRRQRRAWSGILGRQRQPVYPLPATRWPDKSVAHYVILPSPHAMLPRFCLSFLHVGAPSRQPPAPRPVSRPPGTGEGAVRGASYRRDPGRCQYCNTAVAQRNPAVAALLWPCSFGNRSGSLCGC